MKSIKKLLTASIMLVVALVAVVSSTFAWFTTSNPLTVSDLDINVGDSSGIYMSLDGNNWVTTLNSTEIMAAFNATNGTVDQTMIATNGKYIPVAAPIATGGTALDLSGTFQKLVDNAFATSADTEKFTSAVAGTDYSTFTIKLRADKQVTVNVGSILASVTDNTAKNRAAMSMLRVGFYSNVNSTAVNLGWKPLSNSVSGIEVADGYEGFASQYSADYSAHGSLIASGILRTDASSTLLIGPTAYQGYKAAHDATIKANATTELTNLISVPAYENNDANIVELTFIIWLDGWDSMSIDDVASSAFRFNFILNPAS